MKNKRELYMQRCFDLARLGNATTSPNPVVGATLVYEDKIIGEGYHEKYGEAHAEVNAVNSVDKSNLALIEKSELFVSLEPCNIVGNTPACTSLILDKQIKKVGVSVIDKTEGVNHTGIDKLRKQDIDVETGILNDQGEQIAKRRNTYVTKKRPYIILKWAESMDGYIGQPGKQIWLTNGFSKRLVHKWRAESDSIMVGTNTALIDNPNLTTRLFPGPSPLRVVIDKKLVLPETANLFKDEAHTWVFSQSERKGTKNVSFFQVNDKGDYIDHILKRLYEAKKSTLLVEGGRQLLNSFIAKGIWDEIRCFKTKAFMKKGIKAPEIYITPTQTHDLLNDKLNIYFNKEA